MVGHVSGGWGRWGGGGVGVCVWWGGDCYGCGTPQLGEVLLDANGQDVKLHADAGGLHVTALLI